jgi:hypothetical protein
VQPSRYPLKRPPVSFHCYAGSFKNQAEFSSKFPDKEIYHTGSWSFLTLEAVTNEPRSECTGMLCRQRLLAYFPC